MGGTVRYIRDNGQKPLRTEAIGSKSDKVDKSHCMNFTTRTKPLDEFYN